MKTEIEWHPWPETPLPERPFASELLVTARLAGGSTNQTFVRCVYAQFSFAAYPELEVIAWAEMPRPYREPKTEDMHPDAVFARRYRSGAKLGHMIVG